MYTYSESVRHILYDALNISKSGEYVPMRIIFQPTEFSGFLNYQGLALGLQRFSYIKLLNTIKKCVARAVVKIAAISKLEN